MRALLAIGLLGVATSTASATGVTVFLERDGAVIERNWDGSLEDIAIPPFGGTAKTWAGLVTCVREKFAAFDVEIVEQRPEHGEFITAVVGGRAEQLGYDGSRVAGIGGLGLGVTRDGVVHVFSRTVGERDARALCHVTAHEIGHSMGLDHSMQCGDLMSYPREECGFGDASFLDADAPCGEYADRSCHTGAATQSSYRRLAELVGLRHTVAPEDIDATDPIETEADPDHWFTPEVEIDNPFTHEAPDDENAVAPDTAQVEILPEVDGSFAPEVGSGEESSPEVETSRELDSSFQPEVQEPSSCSSHRPQREPRRRWRRYR